MNDETLTIIEPSVNGSEPRVLRFEDGKVVDKGTYMEVLRRAELQRDELLEVLKCISSYPEVRQFVGTIIHDKALAAITKAEGGE